MKKWIILGGSVITFLLIVACYFSTPKRQEVKLTQSQNPPKPLSPIIPFSDPGAGECLCWETCLLRVYVYDCDDCLGTGHLKVGADTRWEAKGFCEAFSCCVEGPNILYQQDAHCQFVDRDNDGDIDLLDYAIAQNCGFNVNISMGD